MDIGSVIKELRLRKGLSQDQFSKKAKIGQTTLSHIEIGMKKPTKKTLEKICNCLGITETMLYVLSFDENDIPIGKKEIFKIHGDKIKKLITEFIDSE